MISGRNPTRRNRNIGTAKAGHGQDNRLVIPSTYHDDKAIYWERVKKFTRTERVILNQKITFVVEQTKPGYTHACTVDDIAYMLSLVPAKDRLALELIVLRQPKKVEEILKPCWGRLAYSAQVINRGAKTIFLDAMNCARPIRWSRSLTPEDAQELARLRNDGHVITEDRRYFYLHTTLESIRSTQLYRTLLHEIGHLVDYHRSIVEPSQRSENPYAYSELWDSYDQRPSAEKETFAHNFADRLRAELIDQKLIPFERKFDRFLINREGLLISDFVEQNKA